MKRILFLLGLSFFLSPNTYAQYLEQFSVANKGILSGPCTTNDPTTCSSNDFTGVNWTITGDLSGMDGTGPDDFRTSGGVMTSLNGDIDEEVCWISPLLDISTAGTVSFLVDVSVTGHDASDYLDVEYDIDQAGSWIQIANLAGGGTHTIDFGTNNNNHTELNVGTSGITGATLQIRVCVDFNSNTESFTIDDAEVPETGVTVISPCTDTAPPTITCPGTQTRSLDGNCNYNVEDFTGLATTTDDCGPVTVTQSPTAGMTFNGIGNSPITLTATDGASNTATCSFTLTLEDNLPPSITCPGTQNRNVDASCIYSLEDFTGSATVSDNCDGAPSVSQSPSAGTNLGVGNQVVTLEAMDASGNTATCTFTVSVTDNMPPNAVCQDGTVQLDGSGNGSINSSALDGGSTDNCPGSLSYVPPSFSFSCSDVGPNTVTVSVVDVSSNSATCTAVVTVQDNIPPTAVCQNATVVLSGTSATLSPSQVDGGSTDNCPPPAVSVSPTMFDCSDVGTNPVTLLVVETSGGTGFSTCVAIVTVQDNTPPTASCMPATIQVGQTLMPSQVDNGSSDNCTNPPDLSVSPNTFGCGNIGTNTVTLTADDTNGNTSTCTAIVTVESNAPPTAVCANFTTNILAVGPMAVITASDVDGGSSSVCSTVILSVDPSTFTCSDIGPNTVTLTATDAGNSMTSTCTAVVTVKDPNSFCCAPPTAMCSDQTVQLDANGDGSTTAVAVGAGSTADCGLASETVMPSDFDCMDIGPNTVTYTITDINGASATCTATVTVEDDIAPTAGCQNTTIQLDMNGDGGQTAAAVESGSTDNCGTVNTVSLNPDIFGCADVGGNTVTLTVNDGNGNTATCTATVTVEDNVPPVANCQDATVTLDASGNGTLLGTDVDNGSSDACGVASVSVSPAFFDCGDLGGNTVTLEVTDNNGNSSTCTATATVEDNIRPSISCPADATFNNDPGTCEATFVVPTPTATDNCAVTVLRYRYRTVDAMGNDTGPWSSWSTAAIQTLPVGNYRFQWQAKDASNNQRRCSFLVDVVDNEPPTAVCLNNTVFLDPSGNYTLQDVDVLDFILSSDNCTNFGVIDIDPASVNCDQEGMTIPVLVTIEDDAGLTDDCTAMITVEQGTALPAPWTANDVGGSNGSAEFKPCDGIGGKFSIDAMGFSLPNSDKQEFVSQTICGTNVELIARVCGVTGGGWAGIQMRETLATGSKKVVLKTQLTPIVRRDIRQSTNGFAQSKNIPRPFNDAYMRLVRQGNFFIGYTSVNGINWQFAFYAMVPMTSCIEVGLYVESINVNTTTTGQFDNVLVNGVPVNPLVAPSTELDIAVEPTLEPTELINLYPNPTNGEVFIDLGGYIGQKATIQVFNNLGQALQLLEVDEIQIPAQRLDLSGYQNGLYFINIKIPDYPEVTRKLMLVGER